MGNPTIPRRAAHLVVLAQYWPGFSWPAVASGTISGKNEAAEAVPLRARRGFSMRARLVSLDGGSPVDLVKDLTLLGRDDDADVKLDHKSISKLHCVIVKTDGLLLVRDLGSTNGTRVNGQRVRRAALLPNDTLAIANLKFTVKFGIELDKELDAPPKGSKKDVPATPLRRNALPDVYPEPKTPRE